MFLVLQHKTKLGRYFFVRPSTKVEDLLTLAHHGDTLHQVPDHYIIEPGECAAEPLVWEVERQLNEGQFVRI
ncbi:MAG: hypothetical protein ACYDB1_00605 [Acidiferrobacteraceae bacterium]